MITATGDGAVGTTDYFRQKFVTTSTGRRTMTGNLVMGSGQVKFADTGHVMLGDIPTALPF